MSAANVQSVLRCSLCNKPFDKQSTLKRHGYYCRSRRAGGAIRTRSCIACARGKVGCDNRRPKCSRCSTKAIGCQYPANRPRSPGPKPQIGHDAATDGLKRTPSLVVDSSGVGNRQASSSDDNLILDGGLVILDSDSANFGGEYLDWEEPDVAFADFLNPPMNEPYLSPRPLSLVRHSSPLADQTTRAQERPSSPTLSIPISPSSTVRLLNWRPRVQRSAQGTANLILHMLKSYPLMMLRHNSLPPFIHQSLVTSDIDNVDMEPLANCISLVHMISSEIKGSRKLFWKNVRLECEHLSEEYQRLSKWELLAAMQALSIYILIRLDEGETDYNNLDVLLIKTFAVIAQQLPHSDATCHAQCALCNNGLEIGWKEWIFRESRRRLAVVYRVVNMLIYFEPTHMCDMPTDFILAPLPARKQLWEAGDEFAWKAESQRETGVQTAFGLAVDGELIKLDEGWLSCSDAWLPQKPFGAKTHSTSTARWEEWCSGIDGFGGLVMLAASLVV